MVPSFRSYTVTLRAPQQLFSSAVYEQWSGCRKCVCVGRCDVDCEQVSSLQGKRGKESEEVEAGVRRRLVEGSWMLLKKTKQIPLKNFKEALS